MALPHQLPSVTHPPWQLPSSRQALAVDARSLNNLKLRSRAKQPQAAKEAAKQFESLFMRELIKSMREATMKSGLLDGAQGDLGTDMLDQQLSVQMSGQPGRLVRSHCAPALAPDGCGRPTFSCLPRPPRSAALAWLTQRGQSAPPTPPPVPKGRDDFVQHLSATAERVAQDSGIPASFMLGQAGHETGWGKSEIKNADGSTRSTCSASRQARAGRARWPRSPPPNTSTAAPQGDGQVPRLRLVRRFVPRLRPAHQRQARATKKPRPPPGPARPWPMPPSCRRPATPPTPSTPKSSAAPSTAPCAPSAHRPEHTSVSHGTAQRRRPRPAGQPGGLADGRPQHCQRQHARLFAPDRGAADRAGPVHRAAGYIGKGWMCDHLAQPQRAAHAPGHGGIGEMRATPCACERLRQLQEVFSGGASGMGAAINDMMNAFSDVVSAPTDLSARSLVLTRMDETAARMRTSADRLDEIQLHGAEELKGSMPTRSTAWPRTWPRINEQIARAKGNGPAPNDLLDQRDQLIREAQPVCADHAGGRRRRHRERVRGRQPAPGAGHHGCQLSVGDPTILARSSGRC
jgi:hypothetical protein